MDFVIRNLEARYCNQCGRAFGAQTPIRAKVYLVPETRTGAGWKFPERIERIAAICDDCDLKS